MSKVYDDYLYWEEASSSSSIDEVLVKHAECWEDIVRVCGEVCSKPWSEGEINE